MSTSSSLSLLPSFPSPHRLPLDLGSSRRLDLASLVFEAAPNDEPGGRRRFVGLPPTNEVTSCTRWEPVPLLLVCWVNWFSSGGGELEDGVEEDGEPGSGGEFILGDSSSLLLFVPSIRSSSLS